MAHSIPTPTVRTLFQSILRRGHELLWCEVIARGDRDYEVHVVPQSNMSHAIVEPFRRVSDAVCRHTEVSWLLRESGWEPVVNFETPRLQPAA